MKREERGREGGYLINGKEGEKNRMKKI